ncbi:41745_t:CDS:1, partial [Gigaspora margarita]
MSDNYNKNLPTLSKYNKSKLRKVDTDNQSAFANSVIIDLINNVVDHANKSSDHLSLLNNSLRSELLENTIPELQVPELPSDSQKPELDLQEVEVQEDLE